MDAFRSAASDSVASRVQRRSSKKHVPALLLATLHSKECSASFSSFHSSSHSFLKLLCWTRVRLCDAGAALAKSFKGKLWKKSISRCFFKFRVAECPIICRMLMEKMHQVVRSPLPKNLWEGIQRRFHYIFRHFFVHIRIPFSKAQNQCRLIPSTRSVWIQ